MELRGAETPDPQAAARDTRQEKSVQGVGKVHGGWFLNVSISIMLCDHFFGMMIPNVFFLFVGMD